MAFVNSVRHHLPSKRFFLAKVGLQYSVLNKDGFSYVSTCYFYERWQLILPDDFYDTVGDVINFLCVAKVVLIVLIVLRSFILLFYVYPIV